MAERTNERMSAAIGRIVVGHDGSEHVVGRPDLGVYVVVPEPGAVLMQALQAGRPLPEATAQASEVAGVQVDGEDFLSQLAGAGLLEPPAADQTVPSTDGPGGGRRIREIHWIEGVSPRIARRLFGPVAWSFYTLAIAFVIVVLITQPGLRPNYEQTWWLPDPILSVLALAPLALVLAAAHEAWHWLAGRAVGVPAIFRVSYRGIFAVFETDLTQMVTIPRRRRYAAFLAGMCFDVMVLAAALGLRLAHKFDLITLAGWVDRLLAAIVLVQVLGIAWQWAALFMRSDGYAVIANALRCHDLYRATWLISKDRLWGLSESQSAELTSIGDHDRKVARWFGLIFLAGMAAMVWMLLAFGIPFTIGMIGWVGHNLVNPSLTSFGFWGSATIVALSIGQYAIIPLLAVRERRLRRTGALR